MTKLPIDHIQFKLELTQRFMDLLERRGVSTKLASCVGKTPSFVSNVKRDKPVNALHLKAVGEVLGSREVLRLLDLPESNLDASRFSERLKVLIPMLMDIELTHPEVFVRVDAYICGAVETAQISDPFNSKKK